jgi:excisionase family DNA binding protein
MIVNVKADRKISNGEWLGYSQAMAFLGVSRSTLDRWRKSGQLDFSKLPNGQLRIRQSTLDEWLDSLVEDWMSIE